MIQNIKSLLMPVVALLLCSQIALAVPKPDKCPSAAVIQYRGLLYTQKDCSRVTYVAPQFDKYGTSAAWVFAVENISASDTTDALNKAMALLPTLSGNPEPEAVEGGEWMCRYHIGQDQDAIAMTIDDNTNVVNLSGLKHKK